MAASMQAMPTYAWSSMRDSFSAIVAARSGCIMRACRAMPKDD